MTDVTGTRRSLLAVGGAAVVGLAALPFVGRDRAPSTAEAAGSPPSAAPATTPTPTGGTGMTATATATAPPPDPQMPVGDLPGWRQVFTEDFTTPVPLGEFPGDVYGGRWMSYDGFRDTLETGLYDPSNVLSVVDGHLDMHLRSIDGLPRGAAPVPLLDGTWGGQLYGRFSVRFRSDSIRGYGTAWLLWPDSDDWAEGEIDFVEGALDNTIMMFNHGIGDDPGSNVMIYSTGQTFLDWHTSTVEWTPDAVTFYFDGQRVSSSDVVPSTPMHLVLQTGTNGDLDLTSSGHLQIDWVAIYDYAPDTE